MVRDRLAGAFDEPGLPIDEALEEIRALTRGTYPAALTDLGLAPAVRSAARPHRHTSVQKE